MRILSLLAQKPRATGSGIYFTELLRAFDALGHEQAALYALDCMDEEHCKDRATLDALCSKPILHFPVAFHSEELPFGIFGMSDVMPYPSGRYRDMTQEQERQYRRAFLEQMRRAVAEFEPDVVIGHHLYLMTSLFAQEFPQIRLWSFCHGTDLRQLAAHTRFREEVTRALAGVDRVFALQAKQAQDISDRFGISRDRIRVVGNGIQEEVFYPPIQPRDAALPIQIAYAGKISKSKGLCSLLRALEHLKEERVILKLAGGVGDVEELAEIQSLAKASSHQVEFLGLLTQKELGDLLRASSMFVLPSFYEGLGLVCIEAAACGLPVVATRTQGLEGLLTRVAEGVIRAVELPPLVGVDVPDEKSLPEFEQDLARAISDCITQIRSGSDLVMLNAQAFSWTGVAREVLKEGI